MEKSKPFVTKNGSPIRSSDGPVKICSGCGHWIRVSMTPCEPNTGQHGKVRDEVS